MAYSMVFENGRARATSTDNPAARTPSFTVALQSCQSDIRNIFPYGFRPDLEPQMAPVTFTLEQTLLLAPAIVARSSCAEERPLQYNVNYSSEDIKSFGTEICSGWPFQTAPIHKLPTKERRMALVIGKLRRDVGHPNTTPEQRTNQGLGGLAANPLSENRRKGALVYAKVTAVSTGSDYTLPSVLIVDADGLFVDHDAVTRDAEVPSMQGAHIIGWALAKLDVRELTYATKFNKELIKFVARRDIWAQGQTKEWVKSHLNIAKRGKATQLTSAAENLPDHLKMAQSTLMGMFELCREAGPGYSQMMRTVRASDQLKKWEGFSAKFRDWL